MNGRNKIIDNMPKVKLIAVTGGACSGKTTFLELLKTQPNEEMCGYRLLFIPEAATILTNNGLRFSDGEKIYQRAILSFQRMAQELYLQYAKELNQNVCIICDRGTLDGSAYCGMECFEELCEEEHTTVDELMNEYDGVIYLVSAALGAPEFYGKQNNDTRRENLQEAIELEHKTLACWKDHPNIVVIDNENEKDFAAKMEEAIEALQMMLRDS